MHKTPDCILGDINHQYITTNATTTWLSISSQKAGLSTTTCEGNIYHNAHIFNSDILIIVLQCPRNRVFYHGGRAMHLCEEIDELVDALRRGELVCFPTDTIYALAADPLNNSSMEKIYKIKGRDAYKPVALLVSCVDMAKSIARFHSDALDMVMAINTKVPGMVTFVLQVLSSDSYAGHLSNGKIGIRIPSDDVTRRVIDGFHRPVAATSVNKSGSSAAKAYEDISEEFKMACGVMMAKNPSMSGISSSVVDFTELRWPKMLREGAISEGKLMHIISDLI